MPTSLWASPWPFLCCFLLGLISQVSSDPTYTIVAPAKIRPNSDYHVSLQLVNASDPADIDIDISGPSNDGTFNKVSQTIKVNPSETRIFKFDIGEWSKGNYKLIVKGRSGSFEFKNETALGFEPKSYSIFVQTDKAIYKPGQAVKFRTIIVNPSLIPTVAGTLDVFIKVSFVLFFGRFFSHYINGPYFPAVVW